MSESPDPEWKTTSDLRALGDALLRISRMLHDHTRRLEVAVEGTYAGDSGDPRVRLLSDSLRISRTADLELGRLNQAGQRVLSTLQEQLAQVRETQEYLRRTSSQLPPILQPPATPPATGSIKSSSEALNSSINNLKRDELETLYEIARTLNSSLVFDEVLRKVMDQVIRVVDAERGFLVLVNPDTNELTFPIARDKQERTIDPREFNFSRGTVERVVRTRQPVLTDDAQVEMKEQESIVAYGIRSIICAPLVVRGDSIGAVYVDSRINANLFGPRHRDLLFAFCHQAAIAIHNARLFDDLTKAIRQVEEDKQYMDNIFASIANGVITTDPSGIITKFNAAAGLILRINPLSAIGRRYQDVFQGIPQVGLTKILQ
ncbi:MAG TPA: GAF domain-containing protein, partial [Ktedonobacteraceae bacterium]|nr:GAF domain-containing protein [Ktedonobacteraceae bacterium]